MSNVTSKSFQEDLQELRRFQLPTVVVQNKSYSSAQICKIAALTFIIFTSIGIAVLSNMYHTNGLTNTFRQVAGGLIGLELAIVCATFFYTEKINNEDKKQNFALNLLCEQRRKRISNREILQAMVDDREPPAKIRSVIIGLNRLQLEDFVANVCGSKDITQHILLPIVDNPYFQTMLSIDFQNLVDYVCRRSNVQLTDNEKLDLLLKISNHKGFTNLDLKCLVDFTKFTIALTPFESDVEKTKTLLTRISKHPQYGIKSLMSLDLILGNTDQKSMQRLVEDRLHILNNTIL